MKRKYIYTIALLLIISACQKLDLNPYDRVSDQRYWKENPEAAVDMVNRAYAELTSASEVLYSDAMTDNAYTKVPNAFNQTIGNGTYSTADPYVASVWDGRYTGIKTCNLLLNNIDLVPNLAKELKNRYIGEAMFLRAYNYYELYTVFGDVPYLTKPLSVNESKSIGKTSRADIIANILTDLNTIIDNNYLSASYEGNNRGRATKWAAMMLKARILLFEGRFAEVRDVTQKIISESGLTLFADYEGIFDIKNENNNEVIFDIQYMPISREHNVQYNFIPPSLGGYSQLSPLQELVDSYLTIDGYDIKSAPSSSFDAQAPFNNRDPRLAATIIYTGNSYTKSDGSKAVINCDKGANPDGYLFSSNSTATGYYIKKYWDNTYRGNLLSGLNIVLMRYADVLLMNAEALAELGQLDAAGWDKTIKPIRQRAGFTNARAINFPSGGNLKEIIRNERRCELALEGLRHKDILRWKTAESVLNGWAHGLYTGEAIGTDNGFIQVENRKFDPRKHYLWPIPQKDIDLNPNLKPQNPNW